MFHYKKIIHFFIIVKNFWRSSLILESIEELNETKKILNKSDENCGIDILWNKNKCFINQND